MKQIVLSVREEKVNFFKELIKNFDFVKVEKSSEPTKDEILQCIERGMKEVELMKQGKLPKKNIRQLLNEL